MGLIEKLESYNSYRTSKDGIRWEVRPNLEDVINKVNEIIDVVNRDIPKHGHWNERYDTQYHFECSICKYLHQYKDNYCPLCGAKMDEVTK